MAEGQIQPSDGASNELRYSRTQFFSGGRNSYLYAPAQDEDGFLTFDNLMPPVRGALEYRWGTSSLLSATNFARNMTPALTSGGAARVFLNSSDGSGASGTANRVSEISVGSSSAVTHSPVFTPAAGASTPRAVVSRNWAFFQDGTTAGSRKYLVDSTPATAANMNSWGIQTPVWTGGTAVPVSVGSGTITLETGRIYVCIYVNENTGATSDLATTSVGGPIAYADSGPTTDSNILVSGLPTRTVDIGADPATGGTSQVTHTYLLATSDGGGLDTLYFVLKVAVNGAINQTDTVPETADSGASLLTNNIYQETGADGVPRGVVGNSRPPIPTALPSSNVFPQIVKHRGRVFIASGSTLYFSKSLADLVTSTNAPNTGRYEESWPPEYQVDLSPSGAENIRGVLSDGQNLYVATQSRIYVLQGEGPEDFAIPQALHNGVGVSYPDTWQIVYVDNQPVGSMWLTPDGRVMLSDFNTYVDVGLPCQDVLNQINSAYFYQSWGGYFGKGVYQLYVLFICFNAQTAPQTALVFDLKSKKWATWDFTAASQSFGAGLNYINPVDGKTYLLLSSASSGDVCKFDDTVKTDFGNNFSCTVRTTWLSLGDAQTRKAVNCLRFVGAKTANNISALSLYGATGVDDFVTPQTLVNNGTTSASPTAIDTTRFYSTATLQSYHRFFSLSLIFLPTSTTYHNLISGYEIDFMHLDKL